MYQKHDVHENTRKTRKADVTRMIAFWATKVARKATFLGVEKMGLTTSTFVTREVLVSDYIYIVNPFGFDCLGSLNLVLESNLNGLSLKLIA